MSLRLLNLNHSHIFGNYLQTLFDGAKHFQFVNAHSRAVPTALFLLRCTEQLSLFQNTFSYKLRPTSWYCTYARDELPQTRRTCRSATTPMLGRKILRILSCNLMGACLLWTHDLMCPLEVCQAHEPRTVPVGP